MIPEERENENSSISIKDIEFEIETCSTKKTPGSNGFTAELHKTFTEEIITILHRLIHNIEEKDTFPKLLL